jgi:hypothetical protein
LPHRRTPAAAKTPPAPPSWTYNPETNIYTRGNRGITPTRIIEARNTFVAKTVTSSDALAVRLTTGEITVQQWVTQMRDLLRSTYSAEYMLGRGGLDAMTQADYGRLGAMLKEQYGYLDRFASDIAAGKLSPAQIQMRARMYIDGATQAHERAAGAARGLVLPAYPGDGTTQCRANCKCSWDIQKTANAWICRWRLNKAEHCPDCMTRAAQWNPLIIPRYG